MNTIRKHATRGQALYETAIAMPLFLIGLFGVIWAMKEASLTARTQLAARFGGMVNSQSQPYDSFSLYAMYATLDGAPPANASQCYPGDGTQLATGYAPFWQPSSTGTVAPCTATVSIINSSGGETFSQPILMRNNYSSIAAQVPVNGYISRVALGGVSTTTVRAAQNFFRSPDVGTLMQCTELGAAVKASLEGASDTSVAAPATPIPSSGLVAGDVVPATQTSACASTSFAPPAAPY